LKKHDCGALRAKNNERKDYNVHAVKKLVEPTQNWGEGAWPSTLGKKPKEKDTQRAESELRSGHRPNIQEHKEGRGTLRRPGGGR